MVWPSIRGFAARMLLPAPMVKAGMFFLADDAPAVVSVLAKLGACQIERCPTELKDYLAPYFPDEYREVYRRLRSQYEGLAQRWQLTGEAPLDPVAEALPTVEAMRGCADALETLAGRVAALAQGRKQIEGRRSEVERFADYMRALSELGLDVQALADLRFLHMRFGRVPVENLDRLRTSAQLGNDVVLALGTRHDQANVVVVGAGGITADLEGLLTKAHFEPLGPARSEYARSPDTVRQGIADEAASIDAELAEARSQEDRLRREHRTLVWEAAQMLARAAVFAECDGVMEGRMPVAFLSGWVVREKLGELAESLRRDVPNPVALVHQSAADDSETPPTEVALPGVFRPAASLIALYGTPGYDEINPALVLAATTPLFFGMMFGDVGYGLVLLVTALAAGRYLGQWMPVAVSCSLASVVFGLLYGSVFGVEHWLPALWLRPIDEPFRLLAVALWAGVAFIVVTFALKAATLLRQGRRREAVLGLQGGAGALVYVGAVLGIREFYLQQDSSFAAGSLVLGGLIVATINTVLEIRAHGRTILAGLASEYFHLVLSLLTNTLSFLRLAAFALSHAALSAALFLVLGTIPATAVGWVFRFAVLLIGSVLILVMHTLVVAIQTIRLEFYEGLTRYYRGDGRTYRPLRFPATTSY